MSANKPGGAPLDSDHRAAIVRLFEELIPFNRFVGLRLEHLERGEARVRMPFRPELIGDPSRPALHGGSLSMLADTAGGAAVFSAAEAGDRVSTIDLRIDYLRPGAPLDVVAEARVIRMGGRVGVARVHLRQPDAPGGPATQLVAEATAVYNVVRRAD